MNRRPFLYILIISALSFLLGCEEEPSVQKMEQPAGFVELVKAYEDGRVFSSATHKGGACVLDFEDGYSLSISEFSIYDCRNYEPKTVTRNGEWWSVGGVTLGIKVDSSLPSDEAFPVYVYFDSMTLHVHVSNGQLLEFWSVALEEQKQKDEEDQKEQEENAKKQNIPVVRIKTKNGAGIHDKKNYVDGTITITDPEKMYSEVTEFTADMGIRGRGNSTWGFPKKPWKVKLDEKEILFGTQTSDHDYTYYLPLTPDMAGRTIETFVLAFDKEQAALQPEVWVTCYPIPFRAIP